MKLRTGAVALIGTLACLVGSTARPAQPTALLTDFEQARAILETAHLRCLLLDVYLAEDAWQHAQGLMFVEQLDEFEGMLFLYPRPARLAMWMKNTYIPLDMLFLSSDGSIAGIAAHTTPLSTERIESPDAVTQVLELNAGFVDRWRVEPGNRLLSVG